MRCAARIFSIRSIAETGERRLDPSQDHAQNPAPFATLASGRWLELDRVTLHDPCNLVRWDGGSEPQRRVLRRCVADFREMTQSRGQLLLRRERRHAVAERVRRAAPALRKSQAEQIRATRAAIVATPCHNCADQLIEISKHYALGVEVQAVVELVYNALVR